MDRVNRCQDKTVASCRVCNGSGTTTCSRCLGRGALPGPSKGECPLCLGSGVMECSQCGGRSTGPVVRESLGRASGAEPGSPGLEPGQKVDFLSKTELFRHLEPAELEKLATQLHLVSFQEGHILRENEPADGLYVIKSGAVQVTKRAGTGGIEVELAILRQGSSFGEIGLIDGLPRSANVTALGATECYYLPRPVFLTSLNENPRIALGLLPALAAMVRNADQAAQTLLTTFLKET